MVQVKENTRTEVTKKIDNEYCGLVKRVRRYDNEYSGGERLDIQPILYMYVFWCYLYRGCYA